jgi:hypothetical protein
LNVAAVKRIYPTVNEAALARSFKELSAQDVRIEVGQITFNRDGSVMVTGQVRQSFTPRVGSGRTQVMASVFKLEKAGDRWVIVERR